MVFNLLSSPVVIEQTPPPPLRVEHLPEIPLVKMPMTEHHPDKEVFSDIVDLISPNYENGPWIAGGCVRRLYEGVPLMEGDVDVFVSSEEMAKSIRAKILATNMYHMTNVVFGCEDFRNKENGITIQLICQKHYGTIHDLLGDFDISAAQFVTNGKTILTTDQSIRDVHERVFRFTGRVTKGFKRLRKYLSHGFLPDYGVWEILAEGPNVRFVNGKLLDAYDY